MMNWLKKWRQKKKWAAFAIALSGAAQSMSAVNSGYSYSHGTTNTYAYDNYGNSASGYGTYSGYTYNSAAVQQAQRDINAQTQATMISVAGQAQQSLNSLSSTILKKTTVTPDSWYGGYIKIKKISDISQPKKIKVIVNAADEDHEFFFEHLKVEE